MGGYYLNATVFEQNDRLPVSFELTQYDETSIYFSNLKHDFPNCIAYKRVSDEALEVSVGGKEFGEDVLWEFDMIRQ